MKKIIAKSSGILLTTHSKSVAEASLKVLKKTIHEPDERMVEITVLSAKLHDIGKCNEIFQKLLSGKIKKSKNKFTHNEIGWAFLFRYLKLNSDKLEYVLNNVYWHHGISNTMGGNNHFEILDSITDNDIETMKSMLVELIGKDYLLETPRDSGKLIGKTTPNYYFVDDGEINSELIIYRSCIIASDRLVSKIESNDIESSIDDELNRLITKSNNLSIKDFNINGLDKDRYNRQLSIVNKCNDTTIVNAPTGFGKTLLGLIWSTMSNKPLLWVVPTNSIAKSVYSSINELRETLNITPSMELFLSGEVVFSDIHNNNGFESDIIITNIDNFLSPSVKTTFADKLFLINTADVVFDEYQELMTDEALLSAFINMIRVRHRYTKARTLLLSATPYIGLETFWDTIGNSTNILPKKSEHYSAMHDKKYKIRVVDDVNEIQMTNEPTLFMTQSIRTAQLNYDKNVFNDLMHSKFEKNVLNDKLNNLLVNHGKSGNSNTMGSIIGTRILQISLDISFNRVIMPVTSPIDFMQGSGRCNRFGKVNDTCEIIIYRLRNRAENAVLNQTYSVDLSEDWFDHMVNEMDGKEFTLDELYKIFNKLDEAPIVNYIRNKYNASLISLSKIHPYRTSGKKKTDVISAGGNKLRCSGSEIFYISKKYDQDVYSEPFNVKIHNSISDEFDESGNIFNRITGAMKTINDSGDERYEYGDIIKTKKYLMKGGKNNIDTIRNKARLSNTPYIVFDRVYHDDYGIIKLNILSEVLESINN